MMASPRAPERFVAECDRRGGNTLLELPVAAVGNSTAASARSANLRVELVGPGSGASLAEQLCEVNSKPTTFILACGRDRRPELPRRSERGRPPCPSRGGLPNGPDPGSRAAATRTQPRRGRFDLTEGSSTVPRRGRRSAAAVPPLGTRSNHSCSRFRHRHRLHDPK